MLNTWKTTCLALLTCSLYLSAVQAKVVVIEDDTSPAYQGILGDKDEYHFSLTAGQAATISIEQLNADVKVALFNIESNGLGPAEVFQLSTTSDTWLNELLYITEEDCTACMLRLLPQDAIDKLGNYLLIFERKKRVNPSEKRIMQHARQGAIAWLNANIDKERYSNHLDNALGQYQKAIDLAEELENPKLYYRNLYHASQIAHLLNRFENQNTYLNRILADTNKITPSLFFRAKFDTGIVNFSQRRIDQALIIFYDLLSVEVSESLELMQALVHSKIGHSLFDQGNYQSAIKHYLMAQEIFTKQNAWKRVLLTLLSLGSNYEKVGNVEKAIENYHQVISISSNLQSDRHFVDANIKSANLYRRVGNIELANEYIESALRKSGSLSNSLFDGWAKQEKARILMLLGQYEYAVDWLNKANLVYQANNSLKNMVNIDYFLSIVFSQLEDYELAKIHASRVLEYDKKNGINYDIGTAHMRLAAVYLGLENYSEALYQQNAAEAHLSKIEDLELQGQLFAQSGEIHFHNGLIQSGLTHFNASKEAYSQSKKTYKLIDTEYRFAKTQFLYGDPKIAKSTLSDLVIRITDMQKSLSRADQQRNYIAKQKKINNLYIDVLHKLGQSASELLEQSEYLRALTLKHKTNTPSVDSPSNESLLAKQKMLIQQLQQQFSHLQNVSLDDEKQTLISASRKISEEIQQLNSAKTKPVRANPVQSSKFPAVVNLQSIQEQLSSRQLLLYFDTGPRQSHVWAISATDIQHATLPSERELAEKVSGILNSISTPQGSKLSKRAKSAIESLSASLIGDAALTLQPYQQLIVIPDGSLHTLPFSILTNSASNSALVKQHSISYFPSLVVFQQLQKLNTNIEPGDKLLLVANPMMKNSTNSTHQVTSSTRGGFSSTELPYTKYEAIEIESIPGVEVTSLKREQATRSAFLKHLKNTDFELLHFATHGVSYTHHASMAGLVLSNQNTDLNLLLAPEISQLNLNSKMVVLSGCETAQGLLIRGEGLMGLSRAFFEAGAKSVVASLWQVQDKATSELMKQFYHNMFHEGLSPSIALQKAKNSLQNYRKKNGRRPWKHPYYWAGFIIQGSNSYT